jgi:hypothetical protein
VLVAASLLFLLKTGSATRHYRIVGAHEQSAEVPAGRLLIIVHFERLASLVRGRPSGKSESEPLAAISFKYQSRHHETMRWPLVLRPAARDGDVERLDDEI